MLKHFLKKTTEFNPSSSADVYGTDYVRTLLLEGIENPFDANSIWHRAIPMLGGGNLAKAFLASHPYRLDTHDFVHAHVHVEVPPNVMAWDRTVAQGAQSASLIRELVKLHQNDFGKRLPPGESPRYRVRAGRDLEPNCVRIRIGHTIYVPDASEPMSWRLEGSRDGIIFEPLGELAQMQRLAMLGTNAISASIQTEQWPWGGRHALLLVNNPAAKRLEFDSEPFDSLKITPDDDLGHYVITSKHGGKERYILRAQRLLLPVKSRMPESRPAPELTHVVTPAVAREEPEAAFDGSHDPSVVVHRRRERASPLPSLHDSETINVGDSQNGGHEETWLSQTDQPRHAMKLIGLAMQRVSRYKANGVAGMGFGFDSEGQLIPPHDPRVLINLHMGSNDKIEVVTGNGKRQVQPGERLPISADAHVCIDAVPREMEDIYAALCRLPVQLTDAIGPDACFPVGREQPVLKALCPLRRKGFIEADERWSSADRMGLSRKAFAIEVKKDGLAITQVGDHQVIYHLDEALGFVERLDRNSQQPFTLPSGHHLVAGPYVWRYEA